MFSAQIMTYIDIQKDASTILNDSYNNNNIGMLLKNKTEKYLDSFVGH